MITQTIALRGEARQATSRVPAGLAAVLLALAYLLPNHAPPWMSFLQESLAAVALMLLGAPALLQIRASIPWRLPELLVLGLLAMPALQYLLGQIHFLQTAWMHGLYLLGLLVALLAGAAVERRAPLQVLWVVLGAAWLAGMVSVGLQVYQWLALQPGESAAWVYRSNGRPAANLGQPNLLGTVLIFALLATYFFWRQARLSAAAALAVAVWLVLGLALTQSRTGLLNATIVAACLLLWHRRDDAPKINVPVIGLMALLAAAFAGYTSLGRMLGLPLDAGLETVRTVVGSRPLAWRIFFEGVLAQPLVGYGWGQSFAAQIDATLRHPAQEEVFLNAHNLLLEVALWGGLPIALVVAFASAFWLHRCIRRAADDGTRLLWLALVVLLVHAMLEYPLAYAYFLLPGGLAAGALSQRVGLGSLWRAPSWVGLGLLCLAMAGFGLTARDYLRVEQSYRDLLYEKARFHSSVPGTPPNVRVLTSLRDLIVFSRLEPRAGMSKAELRWMNHVVATHPGAAGFARLAAALVLNGQPAEAQLWVDRLCSIFGARACSTQAAQWQADAERQPEMQAIRWP